MTDPSSLDECSLLQSHVKVSHAFWRHASRRGNSGTHTHAHVTWPECVQLGWTLTLTQSYLLTVVGFVAMCFLLWKLSAPRAVCPKSGKLPAPRAGAAANEPDGGASAAVPRDAGAVSQPKVRRPQVGPLDGLRLPFICLVAFVHVINDTDITVTSPFLNRPGWMMTYFFVLSGFIFSYTTDDGRFERPDAWRPFMVRRIARLLPVYYIALFVCMWLAPCATGNTACMVNYQLSSLFIHSWLPLSLCDGGLDAVYGNDPSWFVSCLLFLSIVSPWFSRNLPKPNGLLTNCIVLLGVTALRSAPTVLLTCFPQLFPSPLIGLYYWTALRIPDYVAGIYAGRVFAELPDDVSSWHGWGWMFDGMLVFYIAFSYVLCYACKMFGGDDWNAGYSFPWGDYFTTAPACLMCIAAASSVKHTKGGQPSSGLLCKFFAWGPVARLAQYSYAVYLINTPIRMAMANLSLWTAQYFGWQVVAFEIVSIAAGVGLTQIENSFGNAVDQRMKG